MSDNIESFNDAIAQAKDDGGLRSVLLGNGFSRAYSESFSYQRLKDNIDDDSVLANIDELFHTADTADFETVIRQLEDAASLIELYDDPKSHLADDLMRDAQSIKDQLVKSLSNLHPNSQKIRDRQYASTSKFLSNFKRIFTVNYDLLLYWCTFKDPNKTIQAKEDGFGLHRRNSSLLSWHQPKALDEQKVFYLHGAMHLYEARQSLFKLKNKPKMSILPQLEENLENGLFPLVVTEGSRKNKEERISQSDYLSYCHMRLTKLTGSLFIHGFSMNDRDDHIIDAIAQAGSLRHVYVGLFGSYCDEHEQIMGRMTSLQRKHSQLSEKTKEEELRVTYYSSESANLWL